MCMSWLSNLFGSISGSSVVGAVSGLAGSLFSNSRSSRQIAAQAEENQKNRDYNLYLAKLQNKWNLDQWNRENAYNDPSAVMARLKNAGLNPDLVYGNGAANASAASSPSMTSGAPSAPVDMSPMAQTTDPLSSALLTSQQYRMQEAQIHSAEQDAEAKTRENEIQDMLGKMGISEDGSMSWFDEKSKGRKWLSGVQVQSALQQYRRLLQDIQGKNIDNALANYRKSREGLLTEKYPEQLAKQLGILSSELKIKESDAAVAVATIADKILGIQSDAKVKQANAILSDADFLENLPDGLPTLVKILRFLFR